MKNSLVIVLLSIFCLPVFAGVAEREKGREEKIAILKSVYGIDIEKLADFKERDYFEKLIVFEEEDGFEEPDRHFAGGWAGDGGGMNQKKMSEFQGE